MTIKLHPSFAVHPGTWLKCEVIEPYRLNLRMAADRLGVPRQTISRLLDGNVDLSTELALRFEKAFGLSANALLRMQTVHNWAKAREGCLYG